MPGDTEVEHTGEFQRRSRAISDAGSPVKVVLVSSIAILVMAVTWLSYSARQPRPLSGPYKSGRLLTVDRPFPAAGRFAGDPYVGSKICAECHPAEAAVHSRSGHALTLWPAGRRDVSRRLNGTTIPDPENPAVTWSYRRRNGQLYISRRAANKVEECIAEYAFGSGHHATTFVSVIDGEIPALLEHRLTYYTEEGILALTPGQDNSLPLPTLTPNGNVPPPPVTWKCFDCHSTQLSPRGRSAH